MYQLNNMPMGQYTNVPITCVIIPHGKLAHWHIDPLAHYYLFLQFIKISIKQCFCSHKRGQIPS